MASKLAPKTAAADPLPLKVVVLFTSGVGYFQHSGTIDGSAAIPLTFRASRVDDILKSLILIDPAGKVEAATYSSREPVSRVLQSFGIDISQNLRMVDLLEQLRGAPVEVTTKPPEPETITGQVLSVETRTVSAGDSHGNETEQEISSINLFSDTGIRTVLISRVDAIRILDVKLAEQLKRAMDVLATNHDTQQKTVTLHFGAAPARQVEVGYVTESPLWKTSYRLSLGGEAKPYLQGWAMVDNPSDQDWDGINLTLVSGQPISFIQDLYTPLYVPRPVVPPETQANPYPQLSEGDLTDSDRETAVADSSAFYSSESAAAPRSLGATTMGRRSAMAPAVFAADLSEAGVSSAASARAAGELFQYQIRDPVTIPRQQSAMIPIVTDSVKAEKLDIYNADVAAEHPENAVEISNTTKLHLKAGPVTIFDDGSYAGDARMPDVPPGESQLLTYAVDLSITAVREKPAAISRITTISIRRGFLNITSRSDSITTYTFKSKRDSDRAVLVEQPIKPGWNLVLPAKPDQKTRSLYRFRVLVPAKSSVPFTIKEDTP
ncbi:MAG TPA: hypothetical protein VFJ58_06220, partial [Armatimonadota bacterium]|nr:hypothetical protein [Armatimonadota bacterium]